MRFCIEGARPSVRRAGKPDPRLERVERLAQTAHRLVGQVSAPGGPQVGDPRSAILDQGAHPGDSSLGRFLVEHDRLPRLA